MSTRPTVTIGLPVYNGAAYLADALDSLLGQTFEDLELIISDNASTDATAAICQQYAAQDQRVRYVRNEYNAGAAANYNKVFHLANSPYFKWATHDNLYAPEFLERCVTVLETNPSVVLAYAQTRFIDEQGAPKNQVLKAEPALAMHDPIVRFRSILLNSVWCTEVLGLIRTDALRKTSLIGTYYSSDRVLLAELGLLGRLHQVPEILFFWRSHPQQSYLGKTPRDRARWISGRSPSTIVFPQWHIFTGYLKALSQTPLSPVDRLRGAGVIARLATQPDKIKRLIVPGPYNYFGIGAKRKLPSGA